MFIDGGLLFSDFKASECKAGINARRPCNNIEVYDWSDVQVGDEIAIFTEPDENISFE